MTEEILMSSTKPYLIRALYDWIADNDCTPHIVVDAAEEGVEVPRIYVTEDDRIILNISKTAVKDFRVANESISFNARFNGVKTDVFFPMSAVMAIYAQENGRGMLFYNEEELLAADNEDMDEEDAPVTRLSAPAKRPELHGQPPVLRVIKPQKPNEE
jgi:stringent starvation protein B